MDCVLREVSISNFKSLKDVSVPLKKFNVLVGPNGSGKTNFIEFFKFLRKSLTENQSPYAPYLDWWDYRNIVWHRKEELPISAKLFYSYGSTPLHYQVSFSGIGGSFKVLHEKLEIGSFLSFEREGLVLKITYDPAYLGAKKTQVETALRDYAVYLRIILGKPISSNFKPSTEEVNIGRLYEQIIKLPPSVPNLLLLRLDFIPFRGIFDNRRRQTRLGNSTIETLDSEYMRLGTIGAHENIEKRANLALIVSPFNLNLVLGKMLEAIKGMTILRHPNLKEVKAASVPRREEGILEDSSNVNNLLYGWFTQQGKLPERITNLVSQLFPNIAISFQSAYDGRIFLKITEKDIELHPPSIPDGLYKILAILTAIELKPSLLAIDEVENSLHKEALEYILDELRNCESTVLITTHSPLVVDIVKLEDLLIVEKNNDGSKLTRVDNPEKVREKLAELKVTQSDSWLYGELR